jgi:hypothetical protein
MPTRAKPKPALLPLEDDEATILYSIVSQVAPREANAKIALGNVQLKLEKLLHLREQDSPQTKE